MAGTKGKIGGRNKNAVKVERTCEYCGKTDDTVTRVKSYSSKGKCKMIWECKQCLGT